MKKYDEIVEVDWEDSIFVRNRWMNINEAKKDDVIEPGSTLHQTAGYLLSATDNAVIVGLSRNSKMQTVGQIIRIPRSSVKKIRTVRKV